MTEGSAGLRILLRHRQWDYVAFSAEYDKAANFIAPGMASSRPSYAQFQRWLAGDLNGLHYPATCRVLEVMFPGWNIEELISPCSAQRLAQIAWLAGDDDSTVASYSNNGRTLETRRARGDAETRLIRPLTVDAHQLAASRFSDVSAVYSTRSEFISDMPPHTLLDHATRIQASGISLDLLCLQYANHNLYRLAATGTTIQCLFLDPDGIAIQNREHEVDCQSGYLSNLIRLNILALKEQVIDQLAPRHRLRFEIATYDETPRFDILLTDGKAGVIQPYLPKLLGIDSPTFVLRRRWENQGLFPVFESAFTALWEHSQPA